MLGIHINRSYRPIYRAIILFTFVSLVPFSSAIVAVPVQGNGMCGGNVTEALSSYVKGETTLGLLSLSLDDALSPMLNGQDYQLEFSKKAFLNYVHFVFKGEHGPRVVSYAFKKNGDYVFSKENQFESQNIRWKLFNPLYKGTEFCSTNKEVAPSVAPSVATELPNTTAEDPRVTTTNEPAKKKFKLFKDSTEYHEHAKTTRVGVERSIGPNAALRVGPEWESAEGSSDDRRIGVSVMIQTDGFKRGFFKKKRDSNLIH